MLFQRKIVCPSCQSPNCRESRWASVEEKRNHPDAVPYRCRDCSFRFLQPSVVKSRAGRSVPLSAALAAVLLAVVLTFWLTRPDSPLELNERETLAALDPGVQAAAEGGDSDAQFRLGEALLSAPGRSAEDSKEAVKWLKKAAASGNTEAMIALGRLSRTGVGILQDFGQASSWIRTAAQRGSAEGMLELGRLYRDGVGVEKNLVQAYVWFNRASAARNLDAVRERELIARSLTPDELKTAQRRSSLADASTEKVAGTTDVAAVEQP